MKRLGLTSHAAQARSLKREISPDPFTEFAMQWGTVHAIHAGPPLNVDCYIDGSASLTLAVKCSGSYSPTVGDYVLIIRQGSDRMVMGTIAATPSSGAIPPGVMMDFAGSVAPVGFLLCDASSYSYASGSVYIPLYNSLGGASSPWGVNTVAQTFQVPDYRGRVAVGAGAGPGLTNRALGANGGEENHALTAAENGTHSHGAATGTDSVNHTHTFTSGNDSANHTHGTALTGSTIYPSGTTFNAVNSATSPTIKNVTSIGESNNHTHSGTTNGVDTFHTHGISNDGSSTGHNTMQPFAVATKIIKY